MGVIGRWRAKLVERRQKENELRAQLKAAIAARKAAERVIQRHANSAAKRALQFAQAHVGITEDPPGSNRGRMIDQWERDVNMIAQPWCGAFMHACLEAGGVRGLTERMRYCPYIVEDARLARNGLDKIVTFAQAKPGDLVVYQWDTGPVDHVGMLVGFAPNGNLLTVEGNTSAGASGSQSNGGGVFNRNRTRSVVAAIVRPKYPA